jgi:hypothetical protein
MSNGVFDLNSSCCELARRTSALQFQCPSNVMRRFEKNFLVVVSKKIVRGHTYKLAPQNIV